MYRDFGGGLVPLFLSFLGRLHAICSRGKEPDFEHGCVGARRLVAWSTAILLECSIPVYRNIIISAHKLVPTCFPYPVPEWLFLKSRAVWAVVGQGTVPRF